MIEIDGLKAYNIKEVAEKLQLHPRTVQEYISDGRLKAKKVGRKWYITSDNLKAYLEPNDNK